MDSTATVHAEAPSGVEIAAGEVSEALCTLSDLIDQVEVRLRGILVSDSPNEKTPQPEDARSTVLATRLADLARRVRVQADRLGSILERLDL